MNVHLVGISVAYVMMDLMVEQHDPSLGGSLFS